MRRFPPVVSLGHSTTRRHEWASLVSAHAGLNTLWMWHNNKLVSKSLRAPNDLSNVRSVTVTRCGNFTLFGTANGGLHKANLQSCLWRGTNGVAHVGAIEGITTDILERFCVTCGLDGFVRFWDLNDVSKMIGEIRIGSAVGGMTSHREGGLIAVSSDDWIVRIIDSESRSVVREFAGHSNQITAMCFSGDCKWLVTASADSTIRTWDIVSGDCIDGFFCPKPAVAIAFSPGNDLLATAHLDDVGVFLWSNRSYFADVFLRPFDASSMTEMSLPSHNPEDNDFFVYKEPEEKLPFGVLDASGPSAAAWEFLRTLPPQNEGELLKQSGQPETKFLSLIHIDDVLERNKPIEPPSQGSRAPFSLLTVPGSKTLEFVRPEPEVVAAPPSKVLAMGAAAAPAFSAMLAKNDWEGILAHFSASGPAKIDAQIRLLSVEKDFFELRQFIGLLVWMLEARRDFDLAQGFMASFLAAHGEMLIAHSNLKHELVGLAAAQKKVWSEQAAVTHVLVCAAELPFVFEKNGLIYKRLDLADNTTSKLPIAEAVSFVEDALTTDTSVVLIHCAAGSSRSGAIAVALLMRRENLAFHEALQRAQQIRPVILPNPGFVEQLQEWGKGQMK